MRPRLDQSGHDGHQTMNYRSIRDLTQDLLTWELPADIELIVGIPRSGMLVANILALYRNIPFADITAFLEGRTMGVGRTKRSSGCTEGFLNTPRKVLVVDDSCLSGKSLDEARAAIQRTCVSHQLLFAVVYLSPGHEHRVDYYRRVLPAPRLFEWNIMHSNVGTHGCWDLDGVLCRDPTAEENDDGDKYVEFISQVPARLQPSLPLRYIVTSRLEKYRPQTEEWLSRNEIECENLIMLDVPSKEARTASGCHASFKANVYKRSPARVFIESSYRQAVEIARLSGKSTICFETQECISPGVMGDLRHLSSDAWKVCWLRLRSRVKRLHERLVNPMAWKESNGR